MVRPAETFARGSGNVVDVTPARPTLSVVMPAYNEEAAIADAVRDVQTHVFPVVPDAELIVVDDGSRDRTGALLDDLAAREPRLRVLHQANAGHGPALARDSTRPRARLSSSSTVIVKSRSTPSPHSGRPRRERRRVRRPPATSRSAHSALVDGRHPPRPCAAFSA